MLISYQRAKAESLGFDAKGGIMERAERFIVLAIGLLFGQILIPVLWVMLVLTLVTAVQRFVKVWRQASATSCRARRAAPTRRRVSCRGRSRRQRPRRASADPRGAPMDRLSDLSAPAALCAHGLLGSSDPVRGGRKVAARQSPSGGSWSAATSSGSSASDCAAPSCDADRRAFDAYARYWVDSARFRRSATPRSTRASPSRASSTSRRVRRPASVRSWRCRTLGGWEWAGRWLTCRPGYEVTVVVERRPTRAVRLDGRATARPSACTCAARARCGASVIRRSRRTTLCACCAIATSRGRHRCRLLRERRRSRRPGHDRAADGCAIIPVGVYQLARVTTPSVASRRRATRGAASRPTIERVTQRLADELEVLIRAKPEQWHLMQPNWPSDTRRWPLPASGRTLMRVGMISPYSLTVPGGVQNQILGLARALPRTGCRREGARPCDGPPPDAGVTPLGNSLPTASNGSVAPIAPDPAAQLRIIGPARRSSSTSCTSTSRWRRARR